ncbi:hypothetical protein MP963_22810 [Escherichia coli]|nr:hypothetical protein [Escherichia coli]
MGSCAAPSAKGDDKFITTDYLQQCQNSHKGACLPVRAVVENDIHNSIHHDAQLFSVNSHSVLDTAAQSTFIETGEVVSMVVGPLRVMVATSLALFTGAFARPLFLLL